MAKPKTKNRHNDVLVVEISGKRAGTSKQRPTEKANIEYDHLIISNNSEGYVTDWEIVNVPDDYREWYINNIKCSENAWYAPMNRSYAIKYAREHGYKYLVQLDDNIKSIEVATIIKHDNGIIKRYRYTDSGLKNETLFNDFIDMQRTVLENTNSAMVGFDMSACGMPTDDFLRERYVYSFFMLKLDVCPDIFQGDFEDDIEYRLKCTQMGLPVLQIVPFKYSKTGQNKNKDLSGCRAEYARAGLKRGDENLDARGKTHGQGGEHIIKQSRHHGGTQLNGAKMTKKGHSITAQEDREAVNFKHMLKPVKLGVIVSDNEAIQKKAKDIFKRYAEEQSDTFITRTKKVKVG